MVGGGEARGTARDTVAAYTPYCLQNVTLPFGHYASLVLQPGKPLSPALHFLVRN